MEEEKRIQWHPAFDAAMQIELEEEAGNLIFEPEHLLSKKPLQMDLLIIKKNRNIAIKKNIGQIFRRYNVIEYKSPDDNLSIDDFYKVYGYICFYKSDAIHINEHPADELTITFACYHYPVEMLKKLEKERGIIAKKVYEGIYYLVGDVIPIQLILIPELSSKDNYWMKLLRKDLKAGSEIDEFVMKYDSMEPSKLHEALADAVMRANRDKMKEEYVMCDALREICEELMADEIAKRREEGRTQGIAEGREEGRAEGRAEERAEMRRQIAESLQNMGFTIEKIAEVLKIDMETARMLVISK